VRHDHPPHPLAPNQAFFNALHGNQCDDFHESLGYVVRFDYQINKKQKGSFYVPKIGY
jgi:hypothetical protein